MNSHPSEEELSLKVHAKQSNQILSQLVNIPTYRVNSTKEELILTYVENFRRQYHFIYQNRKPLFLNPLNEFGIPKFVCTTVRPTILPYSDLIEWNLTANFIADHLNYDLLHPSYELPKILYSPTKILIDQHGNCFDYANLLCSLLIGVGYDAYIVSGYATREICLMDTTRLQNPYIKNHEKKDIEEIKTRCKKYAMKSPKDFTSKYDAYMHERYLQKIQLEKIQIENEENQRIAEIERPLTDPLYGIRIHAWVVILPGKRDISEAFYIEPTTGYKKKIDDSKYLGIESIWNDRNLWVNMQDCSNGCESIQFDLNDRTQWECMFISSTDMSETDIQNEDEEKIDRNRTNQMNWFDKTKFYFNNPLNLPVSNINAIPYYHNYSDEIKSEIYKRYYKSSVPNEKHIPKDIDLPLSWVKPLDITPQNFQKRYPNSYKKSFFKQTCIEKYAPYSMKDGLILKISEFIDYDFKQLIYMTFHYEHRHDKLHIREYDLKTNTIYEKYRPGRNDHLKEYIYNFEPLYEQTMVYYDKSRLDGLSKRIETANELTDYFIDRDDFLEYRKTIFDTKVNKRPIISITERFYRNPSLNVNDDIQELIYAIKDNKFIITYHKDNQHIIASIRTFIKPVESNWDNNLQVTYQADEDFKQVSSRDLYYKLLKLLEQENEVIKYVRIAENETRDLELRRQQEELSSDLEVSIYDIDRNEKSKLYNKLLQEQIDKEKYKKDLDEIDYLAPYLAAIGNPKRIDSQIAEQLRYTVESDFKTQSIRRANLMQSRYENEIDELIQKQKHHLSISECEAAKFRLEILEQRLKQHQESSKEYYIQLIDKLNQDHRLKEPYIVQ